jgi:YtkA-like
MFAHTAELPVTVGTPRRAPGERTHYTSPLLVALAAAIALCCAMACRTYVSVARPVVANESAAVAVASLGDRPSHNIRYRAEVVSVSSLEVGAPQRWIVRLTRRNHQRLAGARVVAHAWMPDDESRPTDSTVASYLGGGRYQLDGVRFSQPGWWNLALTVDGRAGVDSVAFNVVLR